MKRPEYKRMFGVMAAAMTGKIGRGIFAVFLFEFMQSLLNSTALLCIMSGAAKAVALALLFLANVSSLLLFGGLNSMLTKFSRGMNFSLGMFFDNFRNDFKRSFICSLTFILAFFISAIAVYFILVLSLKRFPDYISAFFSMYSSPQSFDGGYKASVVLILSMLCFYAIAALLSVPFVFVWNILRDENRIPAKVAIQKSVMLMLPNCLHFIGFNFYATAKNLLFIAGFNCLNYFVVGRLPASLGFFGIVTGFLLFVQYYAVLLKVFMSIPIYYYSLLFVNGLIDSQKNREPRD